MKSTIKNQISKITAVVICIIAFSSCKKNEIKTGPTTSLQALNNLFNANLDNIKQTVSFDAAGTFVFTSAQGTQVTIDGTCLRKNGNPVTGIVKLEFVELYDRATMALTNKPTMGINISNEEEVLESGGEFYLNVTQNGVALTTTCPVQLETPTGITGGTKPNMQLFDGAINAAGKLTWSIAASSEFYVKTNPDKYGSLLSSFSWYNYDKFTQDPRPKTHITVLVPTEYLNASTVFLSTNLKPNSLGGISGKYPIGLECNIIFVAEENGNFRYAIKPVTLAADQQVIFSISETTIATSAQFKEVLNALP